MKLAEGTSDLSGDARLEQYKQALKQRDDRINNLKTELENVTQKMNKELTALNQKMEFIMDEKDHQIKVIQNSLVNALKRIIRDSMRSVATVRRTVTFVLLSQLKLDAKFYLEENFQKLKRIATKPKSSLVSCYKCAFTGSDSLF